MSRLGNLAQSAVNAIWQFGFNLESRASRAGPLISMALLGQPAWTPRNYEDLAEESYSKNAVAFRSISEIARCAGSVPLMLFDGNKEIEKHPLLDLIARPNPLQSRSQFVQAAVGFLLIAGNSYIEGVGPRGRAGFTSPPKELWIKRPDRMQVVVGPRGMPQAYRFSVGGQSIDWAVNQITGRSAILHMKGFHPLNDWYGMSPIEAAAYSIDQHNAAGKWNMSLLQNSARPSGALVVDPKTATGLDDMQFQRLKDEIEDKYSGPNKAGRPMLLEGGLTWQEMGISPVDMDWLNGKHTSARDIAMVLGFPAQMLGIPGDNTHRNMEEARLWLWEQTIIPLFDSLVEELNWWLTPLFGDNLRLAPDYDEIPALITRRHVLWDKVTKSDFLTVNEKRDATGYEDAGPEGDVILVPKKNRVLGEKEPEPTVEKEDEESALQPIEIAVNLPEINVNPAEVYMPEVKIMPPNVVVEAPNVVVHAPQVEVAPAAVVVNLHDKRIKTIKKKVLRNDDGQVTGSVEVEELEEA